MEEASGASATEDSETEGATTLVDSPEAEARRARIERLRKTLDQLVSRPPAPSPRRAPTVVLPLPGAVRETPHGPVHVVERTFPPGHLHGRSLPHAALEVDPRTVAKLALDASMEEVDFRRALFLDTETTGLAGGTGTIPFLVGMAYFEEMTLRVEQLFLRRPGEEGPLLAWLAERVAAASCIVTYNGKSFDWPLLRTRFVLNRVPLPSVPTHLDLLPCARRIFRRRLSSVRLVDVEAELLGLVRGDDISGAEIPAVYLGYLRRQDASEVRSVLEHNESDLVSLAALLSALSERYDALVREDDPRDHLSYAEVAARAGDLERALHFARAAAGGGGDAACTVGACLVEAKIARRRGDVSHEEGTLLRALEAATDELVSAGLHLRLAKLYERRLKDCVRASMHAAHTALVEGEVAHARRVARLARRRERIER